jgi:hypothetical protein
MKERFVSENGKAAHYPECCKSFYCGRTECSGCDRKPILDAFKAWVSYHKAIQPDPIWYPGYYKATI